MRTWGSTYDSWTGSAEQRESAANGLSEVVKLTSAAALKPFLIKVTGPLIRVVGDRFAHPVKAAILTTLTLLLDKGGPMLKPFLPQLQTTCAADKPCSTQARS